MTLHGSPTVDPTWVAPGGRRGFALSTREKNVDLLCPCARPVRFKGRKKESMNVTQELLCIRLGRSIFSVSV